MTANTLLTGDDFGGWIYLGSVEFKAFGLTNGPMTHGFFFKKDDDSMLVINGQEKGAPRFCIQNGMQTFCPRELDFFAVGTNQFTFSFEKIAEMNRAAHNKAAKDIPALEQGLFAPAIDVDLFLGVLSGKRVLDVGCGWGYYVSEFTRGEIDYVGIDHSINMITEARKRNPQQQFLEMDFHHLTFDSDSFDGIWACCVFGTEPKARIPDALAELWRVLKPQGRLVLVMPDLSVSDERIEKDDPRFGPMYHSYWDFEEFGRALQDARFKIIHSTRRFESGSMTFLVHKNLS